MEKVSVLFVCSGPGVRGRIAEAYLSQVAPDHFTAHSAQFEEREGRLPDLIVELMNEIGLTIESTFPKSVFQRYKDNEPYDYVITLCNARTNGICPIFKKNVKALYQKESERLSWSIPDFRSLGALEEAKRLEGAREIRDLIGFQVNAFVSMVSASDQKTANH